MPLPGFRVRPLVVHPRRFHLHRTRAGHHRARLVVAIADHESTTVLVDLVGELLHIRRHLGLQRRGQHLPRTVTHDLVDQRPEPGRAAVGLLAALDYLEHRDVPSRPALARQA